MLKQKQHLNGFTLVELIIVITILAILATIAFVTFQGYVKDSRDSTRLTTLKNIESALQTFQVNTGNYPEPENYTLIQASGANISYQGYIGDMISKQIKINKVPLDPLDQSRIIYSSNSAKTKYELLTHMEKQNQIGYLNQVVAADYTLRIPKVIGDSIGILLNQDNSSISGNSIDILKANSGSLYKAYFGGSSLTMSGKDLITVFSISNKNLIDFDDNLVGYWDMETTSQSGGLVVLKDLSKYGNNGVCSNNGVQVNCGLLQGGPQFINGQMYFDGVDDLVNIPDNDTLSFTNNTFTFLIKFKSYIPTFGLINKGASNNWEYSIFSTGGQTSFFTWPLTGSFPVYGNGMGMQTPYINGTDNIYYWMSDNVKSIAYAEMEKKVEYNKGAYDLGNGNQDLKIGYGRNAPTAIYMNGMIDYVLLYKKPVSVSEMFEIYKLIK